MNNELLSILCCPETKQDLTLLEKDMITKINKAITARTLKNRGGKTLTEKIDSALLREDKKFFYPVREDIPIMLIDEAVNFSEFE